MIFCKMFTCFFSIAVLFANAALSAADEVIRPIDQRFIHQATIRGILELNGIETKNLPFKEMQIHTQGDTIRDNKIINDAIRSGKIIYDISAASFTEKLKTDFNKWTKVQKLLYILGAGMTAFMPHVTTFMRGKPSYVATGIALICWIAISLMSAGVISELVKQRVEGQGKSLLLPTDSFWARHNIPYSTHRLNYCANDVVQDAAKLIVSGAIANSHTPNAIKLTEVRLE